jgi:hypothetical protein
MDFFNVMFNILIGISSGIFSSIIVSRIFMINTELIGQIQRVQVHVENLYGILGVFDIFKKIIEEDKNISKSDINVKFLESIKDITADECNSFRKMIFDDLDKQLHEIAVDINDFVEKFRGKENFKNEDEVFLYGEELEKIIDRFNIYKRSYKKVIVRYILEDFTLRILVAIVFIIVVLTIIA